jgi:hypothetical protein
MNLDWLFNEREGFGRKNACLPHRMAPEDVPWFGYKNINFGILNPLLDEYCETIGRNIKTTVRNKSKFDELGSEDTVKDLEEYRIEVSP